MQAQTTVCSEVQRCLDSIKKDGKPCHQLQSGSKFMCSLANLGNQESALEKGDFEDLLDKIGCEYLLRIVSDDKTTGYYHCQCSYRNTQEKGIIEFF